MKFNFNVKNTRFTVSNHFADLPSERQPPTPWELSLSCFEAWDGRDQHYEFAIREEAEQKAIELEAKLDPKDELWRTVCGELFRRVEMAEFLAKDNRDKLKRLQARIKVLERKVTRSKKQPSLKFNLNNGERVEKE